MNPQTKIYISVFRFLVRCLDAKELTRKEFDNINADIDATLSEK